MLIGRARVSKTSETYPTFRARKFCLVKLKSSDLQIYSRVGKKNEKVIVNSKYYRENHCTCCILMFIYLMVLHFSFLYSSIGKHLTLSRLMSLSYRNQSIDQLYKHVRGLIRALQTSLSQKG